MAQDPLGTGLNLPFARVGRDFDVASGVPRIRACVLESLIVRRGELPWNMDLGLNLESYRHQDLDDTSTAGAKAAVAQAIEKEPRAAVTSLTVDAPPRSGRLQIGLTWRVRDRTGRTLLEPVTQTVVV